MYPDCFVVFKAKLKIYEQKINRNLRAAIHKEVKVFIGSFPLIHYEKIP